MFWCCICMLLPGHIKGLCSWHQHVLQHRGLSHLLCLLRFDRSVRLGQCRHCRSDEAPGGEQQGSQRRGGAGGRDGAGEQESGGGHGYEVTTAQPSDAGHGQVKFWGFPLEVQWTARHRAGKGWSYGLAHCWHKERLCKSQSRPHFMPGVPAGGDHSFSVASTLKFAHHLK